MGKSYIGIIPNPHIRDFQRKRLYKAEESCTFWQTFKFLSTKETKDLIVNISDWAEIPVPTLIIQKGKVKRSQSIYATPNTISLPFPLSRTAPYIAHEMAHVVNYNSPNADHHGRYYAATYLEIVRNFIGESDFQELFNSFNELSVKYERIYNGNAVSDECIRGI